MNFQNFKCAITSAHASLVIHYLQGICFGLQPTMFICKTVDFQPQNQVSLIILAPAEKPRNLASLTKCPNT